jgi:ribonuclease Z
MADIIFLGTNGWYDTQAGNTLCILIKTSVADIFLDCGSGFFKADAFISGEKPVYILLSHLHYDHIAGLHGLSKMPFHSGLHIIGRHGTAELLGRYIDSPFTFPLRDLPYHANIDDLESITPILPFGLSYLPLMHSDPCVGYRIIIENKTIAFCTDTGYCDNAVSIAKNSDVLITECSHVSGEEESSWPHLNPESAARIAAESGTKKLFLTHFDARRYPSHAHRAASENAARKIFPETHATYDMMKLHL